MRVLFAALAATLLFVTCAAANSLQSAVVVHKCCPADQQLSPSLLECVTVEATTAEAATAAAREAAGTRNGMIETSGPARDDDSRVQTSRNAATGNLVAETSVSKSLETKVPVIRKRNIETSEVRHDITTSLKKLEIGTSVVVKRDVTISEYEKRENRSAALGEPTTETSEARVAAGALANRTFEGNLSAVLLAPGSPWWLDPGVAAALPAAVSVRYGARPPCSRFDSLYVPTHSRGRFALGSDGSLRLTLRSRRGPPERGPAKEVSLPASDFCTDRVAVPPSAARAATFVVLACPCAHAPCMRKCCAASQVYSVTAWRKDVEMACINRRADESSWSPDEFFDADDSEDAVGGDSGGYLLLSNTGLYCLPVEKDVWVSPVFPASANVSDATLRFLRNASALVDEYARAGALARFCGERVRMRSADGDGAVFTLATGVHVCVPRATATATTVASFHGVLFAAGSVFLVLTLLVYAFLPALRRSAHARALLCHVVALLAGSVTLAAGQLQVAMPSAHCYAVAFVVQFSFLAAFFWLNVMCIDIAWAFGGVRAPGGSAWERDKRKFLLYSLYAWGCPAIISAVTAFLEFAEGLPDSLLRPNFGDSNCWFFGKMATLAYFYAPIAVLLLANLVLFAFTAARILRAQRETAMLRRGDSNRHAPRGDTKRLVLYLKLFCLMGVTWIFEIISWAEGSDSLYWYVTDAINMLRGVFIFVLFCCKPKVLKLIRRRLEELGVCSECNTVNGGGDASRWQRCLSRFCCCSSETNGVRGTLALRRSAQNGSAITTITNLSSSAGSGLASPPSYKMKMNQIKDKKSSLEVPVTGLSRPVAAQADEQMHSAEENLTK